MKDTWQTIIRSIAKYAAGALGAKGLIDGSQQETIVSAIVIVASVVWGILDDKRIARKAATSATIATNIETKTETK